MFVRNAMGSGGLIENDTGTQSATLGYNAVLKDNESINWPLVKTTLNLKHVENNMIWQCWVLSHANGVHHDGVTFWQSQICRHRWPLLKETQSVREIEFGAHIMKDDQFAGPCTIEALTH